MWGFMLAASRHDYDHATSGAPGLLAGRKRARLLVLAAAACCAWLTAGPLVGVSRAASCATSWAHPVTGGWSNAADWTRGVPTSGENACITVPGNYTVTLLDSQSVASLTLGSSSGATTQVLDLTGVPGHNASLSVSANSTVNATGDIVMDSRSGGGYTQIGGPSTATFTNHGKLVAQVEGSEVNYLEVDLTNDGVVAVKSGEFRQDDNTITNNDGNVTLEAGAQFNLTAGEDVFNKQSKGTMTFDITSATSFGTLNLSNGATFNLKGGTADPVLASGYTPPAGTEYAVSAGLWGPGRFTTVTRDFSGDYTHANFLGLVRG
jgi:hypothetical protein